jgi:hypothetical protein
LKIENYIASTIFLINHSEFNNYLKDLFEIHEDFFIPFNLQNRHWLLTYYCSQNNKLLVIDSMKNSALYYNEKF